MTPDKARESVAWRKLYQLLRKEGWDMGHRCGLLEGYVMGRVEGRQEALYLLFQARGIKVQPEERSCIWQCRDKTKLERWIKRAATKSSVYEVLELKSSAPAGQRRSPKRVRAASASRT